MDMSHWSEQERGRVFYVGWIDSMKNALYALSLPSGKIERVSDPAITWINERQKPLFEPDSQTFLMGSGTTESPLIRYDPTDKSVTDVIAYCCIDSGYIRIPMGALDHEAYIAQLPRRCQFLSKVDRGRLSGSIYAIRQTEEVGDIRPVADKLHSLGILGTQAGNDSLAPLMRNLDTTYNELVVYSPAGDLIRSHPIRKESYRGFAVSPDEKWIVSSVGIAKPPYMEWKLFFLYLESDSLQWLTAGNYSMFEPTFSSNGKKLAVCAWGDRIEGTAILVSEAPNFAEFKVACKFHDCRPFTVAWSPDDAWLLVSIDGRSREFRGEDLVLVEVSTGRYTHLPRYSFPGSEDAAIGAPLGGLTWIP